jgi:hypothetical protein
MDPWLKKGVRRKGLPEGIRTFSRFAKGEV